MGKATPGIGGITLQSPDVLIVRLGTAYKPDVIFVPDKRYAEGEAGAARCGCPGGQQGVYTRLADGRIMLCPHCGAVIGRVGRKFVAGNWEPQPGDLTDP